jgi:hypothetical protein
MEMTIDQAFWSRPDWAGDEPFWMRDPVIPERWSNCDWRTIVEDLTHDIVKRNTVLFRLRHSDFLQLSTANSFNVTVREYMTASFPHVQFEMLSR